MGREHSNGDSPPATRRPRVVILGAGFGGLYATRALEDAPVDVVVIDRRNHHLFQPLLYQVAGASLTASDIAAPIRRILRKQANAEVILGDARSIDVDNRRVILGDGEEPYDYLFVATGATHSYFGHDDWAKFAPGLKSVEDALEIRRRVFLAYETAERERDPDRRRAFMTFVVVGGGPTGVELAGALAEISRHTLANEFRHIDPTLARIVLVEGLERILPSFPPDLSARAARQLERMGVSVWTNARVTDIDAVGVSLGEDRIEARTILWAAGVAASPIGRCLGAPLDRAGRVLVNPYLQVPGHEEVFVIGDLASLEQDGEQVPGVAPAAMQEARYVADAIERTLRGESLEPFRYHDKGMLATIGRASGVARFKHLELSGFPAWVAWLVVHIFFLIGFRNRLRVMLEWAYAYITYDRGSRLITGEFDRLRQLADAPVDDERDERLEEPAARGPRA
ncbi:MAG: NAD(P)/FAD-dependent oxidoreductase [Actinomycetota bacterium]